MTQEEDWAARGLALAENEIAPLMRGKGPEVQGGALAVLLGMFLAGHHPDLREEQLKYLIDCAWGLLPHSSKGNGRPLEAIMRDLMELRQYALDIGIDGGAFAVRSPIDAKQLLIIASTGMGWDHVSVSRRNRCPSWREMEFVKRLFFRDDETAMQLHVPASDHVNCHPNCLHLWRPQRELIPRPPSEMVGPK